MSPERNAAFKAHVQQFALAEWPSEGNKKGSVHCYYHDKAGSDFEAYLVKESFMPKNTNDFWYAVSGSMECAAGADKCLFQSHTHQTHLANR